MNNKVYSNLALVIPRVSARMHKIEQVERVLLGSPITAPQQNGSHGHPSQWPNRRTERGWRRLRFR